MTAQPKMQPLVETFDDSVSDVNHVNTSRSEMEFEPKLVNVVLDEQQPRNSNEPSTQVKVFQTLLELTFSDLPVFVQWMFENVREINLWELLV